MSTLVVQMDRLPRQKGGNEIDVLSNTWMDKDDLSWAERIEVERAHEWVRTTVSN